MLKYKCKAHMQICALLSQVHKHREAVIHAVDGIKLAHFLVTDMASMASAYTAELLQRKPLEEISIINNPRFSLLEKTSVKVLPIIKELQKRMAVEEEHSLVLEGHVVGAEVDMKNLLGYLNQQEWIYSLNIGNIMQIAPLTMQDFLSSSSLEMELTREYVLEKVLTNFDDDSLRYASLPSPTSAWALNSASCTSCRKCWANRSTLEATPSTGTGRQWKSQYPSCRVSLPWSPTSSCLTRSTTRLPTRLL